jgi:hypothetical protein
MNIPDGSKVARKIYSKNMTFFENFVKASFRAADQKWAIDVDVDEEYPEIVEGYMVWTGDELLLCFEPAVDQVIELIKDQIVSVTSLNYTIQVECTFHVFMCFERRSSHEVIILTSPFRTSY